MNKTSPFQMDNVYLMIFVNLNRSDSKHFPGITSGEASPTFGYANFSVFIDRMRNKFLKK